MQLDAKSELAAGLLPHGDGRKLGILRALSIAPTFLLLDEPGAGLNEMEKADLVSALRTLPR